MVLHAKADPVKIVIVHSARYIYLLSSIDSGVEIEIMLNEDLAGFTGMTHHNAVV